jgi:SAM-dependent methyltransferase
MDDMTEQEERGSNGTPGVMDRSYAEGRQEKLHLVFRYKVRARVVADAVRRCLGRSDGVRVLDFGAAEGATLLELNRLMPGSRFDGIEYSAELLSCAPSLPGNIRLLQGDVTKLPEQVDDGAYDAVSALALLEHLPDPAAAMSEACRALRPGGVFVATCPNPVWDSVSTRLGLLQGECHETPFNRQRLIEVVRKAGLQVSYFEVFMWAPVGFLPYLKIPVPARLSLQVDRVVAASRLLNWSFVNQCVVARKP